MGEIKKKGDRDREKKAGFTKTLRLAKKVCSLESVMH